LQTNEPLPLDDELTPVHY